MLKKRRPDILPGDLSDEKVVKQMIRVNQAGEYGARMIYRGQLKVLPQDQEIFEMYEQEKKHLDYFNKMMVSRRVRPTLFSIPWHFFGFAMGFVTAKLSRESAMACTVAVEDVIGNHYNHQIQQLKLRNIEKKLTEVIAEFRDDELEHQRVAHDEGAKNAKNFNILSGLIKKISRLAISISKQY